MPVYRLDERLLFPPAELADDSGVIAVDGDLRPERLLLGYASGIFPWYGDDLPIIWHSPDPRFVLEGKKFYLPRSLRKVMRRRPYEIRLDTAFDLVIRACATAPRPDQQGTWLVTEMIEAYEQLHALGFAHSAEAWRDGELVGGLYGVSLGGIFFGESMFARVADASKVAFATLVAQLMAWGIDLIDCQVFTQHLSRFGAEEWPRSRYLAALEEVIARPTRAGRWVLDPAIAASAVDHLGQVSR